MLRLGVSKGGCKPTLAHDLAKVTIGDCARSSVLCLLISWQEKAWFPQQEITLLNDGKQGGIVSAVITRLKDGFCGWKGM